MTNGTDNDGSEIIMCYGMVLRFLKIKNKYNFKMIMETNTLPLPANHVTAIFYSPIDRNSEE